MKTIAIAGKGGTGKTTITALIIRWLKEHSAKPILAVDADSNVNLNDVLGVELKDTIGAIREEAKTSAHKLPAGMTKPQFLEYKIQTSLVEAPDFDLIAMGRPEGPGCYCYANNLLRDILRTISSNYEYVLIDNQAGMEHLSRRITQNIDYLLIEKYLVLNRIQNSISQQVKKAIEEEGLNLFQSIPEDEKLLELDRSGKPVGYIAADSPAYQAVDELLIKLLNLEKPKKKKNDF